MGALNYHHLEYFWTVARAGGVAAAARELRVAESTISAQIKAFERSIGEPVFRRSGRGLVLTEVGRRVLAYAEEIFALGRECLEMVHGQPSEGPAHLRVGVEETLHKLIVYRLLEPVLKRPGGLRITCIEDRSGPLLEQLLRHEIDVVLCNEPIIDAADGSLTSHVLGRCGVSFFAPDDEIDRRATFPDCLHGAALLLPLAGHHQRRQFDRWFADLGVVPRVVGEFDDSALMKVFGQAGVGLFPGPRVIAADIARKFAVHAIGSTNEIELVFVACRAARRVPHPVVEELCHSAGSVLFAGGSSERQ